MEDLAQRWQALAASAYFWDGVTFACLMVSVLGFLIFLVWLLGLPGRIAIARKHPDAEAVYAMGWVGFIAIVPWVQALIWAFKPTEKIDIRYFPEQEQAAEREDLRRLTAYAYGKKAAHALESEVVAGTKKTRNDRAEVDATDGERPSPPAADNTTTGESKS